MLNANDIISTLAMVREENLDLRSVTAGINLSDCVSVDLATFTRNSSAAVAVPVFGFVPLRYGVFSS